MAAFLAATKLGTGDTPAWLRVKKGIEVRRHNLADGRHVYMIATVESDRIAVITVREDTSRFGTANVSAGAAVPASERNWKAEIAEARERAAEAGKRRRKARRGDPDRARYADEEQRAQRELRQLLKDERRAIHDRYRHG